MKYTCALPGRDDAGDPQPCCTAASERCVVGSNATAIHVEEKGSIECLEVVQDMTLDRILCATRPLGRARYNLFGVKVCAGAGRRGWLESRRRMAVGGVRTRAVDASPEKTQGQKSIRHSITLPLTLLIPQSPTVDCTSTSRCDARMQTLLELLNSVRRCTNSPGHGRTDEITDGYCSNLRAKGRSRTPCGNGRVFGARVSALR